MAYTNCDRESMAEFVNYEYITTNTSSLNSTLG